MGKDKYPSDDAKRVLEILFILLKAVTPIHFPMIRDAD